MTNQHMKICSESLIIRVSSQPQWGIISHRSECPSSQSLQMINAGEVVEKREPSTLVGMQNGMAAMEKSVEIP